MRAVWIGCLIFALAAEQVAAQPFANGVATGELAPAAALTSARLPRVCAAWRHARILSQRTDPAPDVLLLEEGTLRMVWTMRRMLSAVGTNEGIELLLNRLAKTNSNAEFLASLTKAGAVES